MLRTLFLISLLLILLVTRYPAGLQNSNVITQGTAFPTDNLALNQLFILTEAITGPPAFGAGLYRLTRLPDAGPPVVTVEWTLVANIDAATTAMERIAILRNAADGAVSLPTNVTPASLRTLLETERTFNLTVAERDNTDSDMGTVYAFRENDIWIDSTDGRTSVYTDSQWLQIAGKERIGGSDFDLGLYATEDPFGPPNNIDLMFGLDAHTVEEVSLGDSRVLDPGPFSGAETIFYSLTTETLSIQLVSTAVEAFERDLNVGRLFSFTGDRDDQAFFTVTDTRRVGGELEVTGEFTTEGLDWFNRQTLIRLSATARGLDLPANAGIRLVTIMDRPVGDQYATNPDVIRLDLGGY